MHSLPTQEYRQCEITGPDGVTRPGWELQYGSFPPMRALRKDELEQYAAKLANPDSHKHPWQRRKSAKTELDKDETELAGTPPDEAA